MGLNDTVLQNPSLFLGLVSLWNVSVLVVMLWNQFGMVLQLDLEVTGGGADPHKHMISFKKSFIISVEHMEIILWNLKVT